MNDLSQLMSRDGDVDSFYQFLKDYAATINRSLISIVQGISKGIVLKE